MFSNVALDECGKCLEAVTKGQACQHANARSLDKVCTAFPRLIDSSQIHLLLHQDNSFNSSQHTSPQE